MRLLLNCLLLFALLLPVTSFSQNENASLIAQSPDGKIVKLVWLLRNAPNNVTGFDIKRKDGLSDWKLLNSSAIVPGISQAKDLSAVESDAAEAARIKDKMKTLMHNRKLREYDPVVFADKWKNNDHEMQDIIYLASTDFDISMMCGLAFVDRTLTQKTNYLYGLFMHGTNELLATAHWNYGETPDLNVITDITSRSSLNHKGIQIFWSADPEKSKNGHVEGFNIYKGGIQLNDQPITQPDGDVPYEYKWNDLNADPREVSLYSISAESIFGIEGIVNSYTYRPEDHPDEYRTTGVTEITSLGYYFKDGIRIKWTFPQDYQKYIAGFYIEKDNMPDGFRKVSKILPADARTFVDKTGSPVSGYVRIRVNAVYTDKTVAYGKQRLYSYYPLMDPPKPQNTTATVNCVRNKCTVHLTWDPTMTGDSETTGFVVYQTDDPRSRFERAPVNVPVNVNSYSLLMPQEIGSRHYFSVAALNKTGFPAVWGDTVSIIVPTTNVPVPNMKAQLIDSNRVEMTWNMAEIPDLAGFRIYVGNKIVADEQQVNQTLRNFRSIPFPPGTEQTVSVRAVTDRGITSEMSSPITILIPEPPPTKKK